MVLRIKRLITVTGYSEPRKGKHDAVKPWFLIVPGNIIDDPDRCRLDSEKSSRLEL